MFTYITFVKTLIEKPVAPCLTTFFFLWHEHRFISNHGLAKHLSRPCQLRCRFDHVKAQLFFFFWKHQTTDQGWTITACMYNAWGLRIVSLSEEQFTGMIYFSYLTEFSCFPLEEKSCSTGSKQIKKDLLERVVDGFSYFSLMFSYQGMLFSNQNHPCI